MTLRQTAPPLHGELEDANCPICDSSERSLRFELAERYRVARCSVCGVYYLSPRPIEASIQEVYRAGSYFEGGASGYADTSYLAQERALRATFKRLLRNLAKRRLTGGDLLEVGCGYGYLLDEARSFFRRRIGTEFSDQGANIARKTGAEVLVGGLEQLRNT